MLETIVTARLIRPESKKLFIGMRFLLGMVTAPVLHDFLLSFSAYGSLVANIVPSLHLIGTMAYGPWLTLLGVGCVSTIYLYHLCTQPLQATSRAAIFTAKDLDINPTEDMQLHRASDIVLNSDESKLIIEHRERNIKKNIESYRTRLEKFVYGPVGLFLFSCLIIIWGGVKTVLLWELFKNFAYFVYNTCFDGEEKLFKRTAQMLETKLTSLKKDATERREVSPDEEKLLEANNSTSQGSSISPAKQPFKPATKLFIMLALSLALHYTMTPLIIQWALFLSIERRLSTFDQRYAMRSKLRKKQNSCLEINYIHSKYKQVS